jgi:hypothetical protein
MAIQFTEALLHCVGFRVVMWSLVPDDESVIHEYVEIVISDELV